MCFESMRCERGCERYGQIVEDDLKDSLGGCSRSGGYRMSGEGVA
jgi:hypothetical protein